MIDDGAPAKTLKYGYRRGLVLGLTIAEMFLLILFALLLALAAWSIESKKRESVIQEAAALAKLSPEDFEKMLARAANAERLEREAERLRVELREFENLRQSIEKIDDEDDFLELVKSASVGAAVRASLQERDRDLEIDPKRVAAALSLAAAAERQGVDADLTALASSVQDLETLRGQYANLRQRLESAGLGLEMPPCWATADGRPEYIFSIALKSNGLRVRDTTPSHRAEARKALPIPKQLFDDDVSPTGFLSLTNALLDWSKAQNPECRFFIRVFDLTPADRKDLYKSRLRTVEHVFYKYEVRDVETW